MFIVQGFHTQLKLNFGREQIDNKLPALLKTINLSVMLINLLQIANFFRPRLLLPAGKLKK